MKYKFEIKDGKGNEYTLLLARDDPHYKTMKKFLDGSGYNDSDGGKPGRMQYSILPDDKESTNLPTVFIRVKCTNKQCQAGFIPCEGKFEMCPTCKGDATILKEKEKSDV